MRCHIYILSEGSDYFGEHTCENEVFCFTIERIKYIHASPVDLLHTVFRIENLDLRKCQKQPLEVLCEKKKGLL